MLKLSRPLQKNDYDAHIIFFDKNKALLQPSNNRSVLEKLRLMNVSKLTKNNRKEFLTFLIAYSVHMGKRDKISTDIENLLDEYKDELDPMLLQNLIFGKSQHRS